MHKIVDLRDRLFDFLQKNNTNQSWVTTLEKLLLVLNQEML
jgi:hypothetical protein